METDAIAQVMIDDAERLCVTPAAQSFTMIYRAAIEVTGQQPALSLLTQAA